MPKIVDSGGYKQKIKQLGDDLGELTEIVEACRLYDKYLTKELRKEVKPETWTFNVKRDTDGYIHSISANGSKGSERSFNITRDDDMRIKQISTS